MAGKKKRISKNLSECTLYVEGMHCAACELLIEKKLKKHKGISKVDARLGDGSVIIEGDLKADKTKLASELTKLVQKEGYTIKTSSKNIESKIRWMDFIYAIPAALIFILLFMVLQKSGILQTNVDVSNGNYLAFFVIGLVASVSSCAALVGGLVLSLSANFAKEDWKNRFVSQVAFHLSRLISFFILGGFLGLLSKALPYDVIVSLTYGVVLPALLLTFFSRISKGNKAIFIVLWVASIAIFSCLVFFLILLWDRHSIVDREEISKAMLSFFAVAVMLLLGLNLLELFPFLSKFQLRLPKALSRTFLSAENLKGKALPLILGIITFFLPCGFTLSAQAEALSLDIIPAAFAMLAFALGTLPALALISFTSINLGERLSTSGAFFKTSGIIVIFFALSNLLSTLFKVNLIGADFLILSF